MVCIGLGSTLTASVALAPAAAAALTLQTATLAAEAATIAVQAFNVAAESALEVVAGAGEKLATEGEEQFEAETTSRRWHMAAAEAVGTNASIRLLAARARRVGVPVSLPGPIVLDRLSLDAVAAWLVAAVPQVQRAREELAAASLATARQRLTADLPVVAGGVAIDDALRRYADALIRGRSRPGPAAAADLSWVDAEIGGVLVELDPDAAEQDRQEALRAAARVASQTDEMDADAFLDALKRLVHKEINPRAAAARRAARWLEGLEHPQASVDPALAAGITEALAAVVAGTAPLTPDLHDRAQRLVRHAARLARTAYRTDLLRGLLVSRGFAVVDDGRGRLRLSHIDWGHEHTATVWLDHDGGVHHELVGRSRPGGDTTGGAEAARDVTLACAVADAVHDMTHDGVHELFVQAHEIQHEHGAGATTPASRPVPRARHHQ